MPECKIVSPGWKTGTVIDEDGAVQVPPEGWSYLRAGDAALTRKVKSRTSCWQVQVKQGRRTLSKGIWADGTIIASVKEELAKLRESPEHQKKQAQAKKRREKKQVAYVDEFYQATLSYLNFNQRYRSIAEKMARAVTEHATPVGSGTVARTERIELPKRVEAAVIAWMRHQTTAYDQMRIARIKGERRQVRRELAQRSKQLLEKYRQGADCSSDCPLLVAVKNL